MRLAIHLDLPSTQKICVTPLGNGYEPAVGIRRNTLGGPLLERGSECLGQQVFRGGNVARPRNEQCHQSPIALTRHPLDRAAIEPVVAPLLSQRTKDTLAKAANPEEWATLLLSAPEFMYR